MDNQKQITEKLKQANNVLVTVSRDPTVDQLAALLGLSLALTKLDKHAAAVYSGETPSTLEFLQPEDTFERTTDSLRDFIISLDKSKADKLRYKVEDNVVRIFITPYRTSISQDDFEFSQGDFNIDVVVAIGVHQQQDLDEAIMTHGRILHDATITTINNDETAELGSINWLNESASSVSEMATALIVSLGKELLDEQIATALLTGIVAETDRFRNEKTTANTMKASAALMAAGANQQLVATKLEEAAVAEDEPTYDDDADDDPDEPEPESPDSPAAGPVTQDDGTLRIDHEDDELEPMPELPKPVEIDELPPPPVEPELQTEVLAEDQELSQDENTELPPVPGATIEPQPDAEGDEPPHLDDEDLPKISRAFATGDSVHQPPSHVPEPPKEHHLMQEKPTFNAYDTTTDDKGDDGFIDTMDLSLPEADDADDKPDTLLNRDQDQQDNDASDAQDELLPVAEPLPVAEKPEVHALVPHVAKEKPVEQPMQHQPEPVQEPKPELEPESEPEPEESSHFTPRPGETLAEIEQDIASPYAHFSKDTELDPKQLQHPTEPGRPAVTVDAARDAVADAMVDSVPRLEPIAALNAQPLGEPLHEDALPPVQPAPDVANPPSAVTPVSLETPFSLPVPEPVQAPAAPAPANAAPPVPPPFLPPQFGA